MLVAIPRSILLVRLLRATNCECLTQGYDLPLSNKHCKTLARIWEANPNVRYMEVESLIVALGGELISGGKGSHFRAKLNGKRTTIAKPHGSDKTLDIGAIKGIKKFLELAEITEDGN